MAFRVKRLRFVSHAVEDLDAAVRFWTENFGVRERSRSVSAEIGLKAALIDVGNTEIEVIEPLPGEQAVRRWLDRHGPGAFLVSLEVEDLLEGVRQFRAKGWRVIEAWGPVEEKGICFLHPKDTLGIYLQIFERGPDGSEP